MASEFQINSTTGGQRFPTVASEVDGDFVVAWLSYAPDRSTNDVFPRRFSSTGSARRRR